MKKRYIYFLILQLLSLVLSTGCASKVEINDIAVVTGIALDAVEDSDEIKVTYQILDPVAENPESERYHQPIVISEQANTISSAIELLQRKLPRKTILSHNHTLIIGEELAKKGIATWIEYFTRYYDARLQTFLYITEGEAADILDYVPDLEYYSGEILTELEIHNIGLNATMLEAVNLLSTSGKDLTVSKIAFVPHERTKAGESSPNILSLKGIAIFKEDKLIDFANEEESLYLLLLLNPKRNTKLTIDIPTTLNNGQVGFELFNTDLKLTPKISSNKITMNVEFNLEAYIYENTSKLDFSNPESLKIINNLLTETLKGDIYKTIKTMQESYNSDVLGFGREIHKAYPSEWDESYKDNWDDVYQNVEVLVSVEARIESVGNVNNSLFLKDDEMIKFD